MKVHSYFFCEFPLLRDNFFVRARYNVQVQYIHNYSLIHVYTGVPTQT
jgi:hypothetical protein